MTKYVKVILNKFSRLFFFDIFVDLVKTNFESLRVQNPSHQAFFTFFPDVGFLKQTQIANCYSAYKMCSKPFKEFDLFHLSFFNFHNTLLDTMNEKFQSRP